MIDKELVRKHIKVLEISVSSLEKQIKELRKELKDQKRRLRDEKILYWQAGGEE